MNGAARVITSNATAAGSLVFLALLVTTAFFSGWLTPYDPNMQDLSIAKIPPCPAHPLGTDFQGGDVLSKIVAGSRQVVAVALGVSLLTVAAGFLVGLVAGYRGGWVDAALMRTVDIMLAFPSLLLNIILVAVLGAGFWNLFLALTLSGWAPVARITRSLVLSLAGTEYVACAKALGATGRRVLVAHIVPNCSSTIVIVFAMRAGTAVLGASALNYLGLGDPADTNAWGTMVNLGQYDIVTAWWWPLFPATAIALTVAAMNLLADALRDYLDPRMKAGME